MNLLSAFARLAPGACFSTADIVRAARRLALRPDSQPLQSAVCGVAAAAPTEGDELAAEIKSCNRAAAAAARAASSERALQLSAAKLGRAETWYWISSSREKNHLA